MDFNNPNAYGGQFANSPQHAQFDAQARLQQQANPHGQYAQSPSFPGMGGATGSNGIQPGAPYLQQRGKPVTCALQVLPYRRPWARSWQPG
jgi:hypothetical protein